MKNIQWFSLFTLMCIALNVWSEDASIQSIQVVVNSQSEITKLTRKQVMGLFLGRSRSFPSGVSAKAFDHEVGSGIRARFFEGLTGKSISDIDAYWARLRYSGRASPPKVLGSMGEILNQVSDNKHAIAYTQGQDPEELMKQNIIVVHMVETD